MEIRRFKTFMEFAEERVINKSIYNGMEYEDKRRLKFYIYYVLREKNDKKDLIWEYLNEPMDSEAFILSSILISNYARRKK